MTEPRQIAVILAVVLLGGIACGAGGMYVLGPQRTQWSAWFYYSQTDNALNLGIKPNGEVVFGEKYDRQTEALKLLELFNTLKWSSVPPACHETGYEPPVKGVRRIYPGTAWPSRLITEQAL